MDKSLKTELIIGGMILAVVIVVHTVTGSLWGGRRDTDGMMGSGIMGGFGTMGIIWMVILGAIIWAVVAAARGTNQPGGFNYDNRSESTLEILKRRYASGMINKVEYEEKRSHLI